MPQVVDNILAVGWPKERLWVLALCKVAAGAGLIVGILYPPIGLAAAIGIVLYFGGALVFHYRAKNKQIAPAVVYLAISTAAVVLISLAI